MNITAPTHTISQLLTIIDNLSYLNGFARSHPTELCDILWYTKYLPQDAILSQRIWHLRNGVQIPRCDCGTITKWHHVKKAYNPSCSVKCANNSVKKITNIKQTVFDRYGNTSYARSLVDLSSITFMQDPDWLYNQHFVLEKPLSQIADELGVDATTVGTYFKNFGMIVKRFSKSKGERELHQFVSSLNIEVHTNTKQIITPYELDIFLPNHKTALEYCGVYWHSTKHSRITPQYHKQKWDLCEKVGIRLITIFEDEWIHNNELIKSKILSVLQLSTQPRVYARKATICEVGHSEKIKFLNKNHIQGSGPGSITIGLESNNNLIACMTFIQQTGGVYILNRYATSCQVPGGFSKLLSYFKRYCDRYWYGHFGFVGWRRIQKFDK